MKQKYIFYHFSSRALIEANKTNFFQVESPTLANLLVNHISSKTYSNILQPQVLPISIIFGYSCEKARFDKKNY